MRGALVIVGAVLLACWLGARWERSEQAAFLVSDPTPPGEMVRAGRHELHVVVEGTGGPGVLFISGLGDNYRSWAATHVQSRVAEATLTVSYDRPGLGWSPVSDDDLTLDAAVADLFQLVSTSGLFAEPPILVGHSLGGALARRYAYRHPDAVSGLVLVDPTPTSEMPTVMRVIMGTMMRLNSVAGAVGMSRRGLYRQNPEASRDEQLLFAHLYASGTQAHEVRREYLGAVGSTPIPPTTGGLGHLPLIVVAAPSQGPPGFGSVDRALDLAKRRMVEESANGRLVEVETSHYIHHDDPDVVVAEVLKMVDVVSAAAAERP